MSDANSNQVLGTDGKPLDLSVVNAAPLEVGPGRTDEDANVVSLSSADLELPVEEDLFSTDDEG